MTIVYILIAVLMFGLLIAIHEFGHNVEQTLSLYDVDYYMLNGVPNTAFTEALAFVFQKRDLEILAITDPNPEKQAMEILDKVWSMYEICGARSKSPHLYGNRLERLRNHDP